jgi:hypothetical protein
MLLLCNYYNFCHKSLKVQIKIFGGKIVIFTSYWRPWKSWRGWFVLICFVCLFVLGFCCFFILCLTIFQLYRGVWFIDGGNHRPAASHWLYHIVLHLALSVVRFELTSSVVIGTDYIGSCKSNYHTITDTTVPCWKRGTCIA